MNRFVCLLLLGLFPTLSFAADPVGWGVVTAVSAKSYDKAGTETYPVAGGTLFTLVKEVLVNKQPAYLIMNPARPDAQRIVLAEDCRAFMEGGLMTTEAFAQAVADGGDLSALTVRMRRQKFAEKYYSMIAQREALVEKAREAHLSGSPAGRLAEAKRELAKIPAKDRALEQAEKRARTNAQRLKLRDDRKELRYRATGLRAEIDRLKETAGDWEKAHPFDDSEVRKNGVYKTLTRQLEAMRPDFETLLNGTPAE